MEPKELFFTLTYQTSVVPTNLTNLTRPVWCQLDVAWFFSGTVHTNDRLTGFHSFT